MPESIEIKNGSGSGVATPNQDSHEGRETPMIEVAPTNLKSFGVTSPENEFVQPSEDSFEMDSLKGNVQDWRDIVFPALNTLPDCPALKALKAEINDYISSLWKRNRDFGIAALEGYRLQTLVVQYIIESKKIRPTRGVKPVLDDSESLKEIEPTNVTETRAMVLLRVLKLHPERALSTSQCKALIEASEGSAIDNKVVKRAMEFLDRQYDDSLLVLEKNGKNSRLRVNFSPKPMRASCPQKS